MSCWHFTALQMHRHFFNRFINSSVLTRRPTSVAEMQPQTKTESPLCLTMIPVVSSWPSSYTLASWICHIWTYRSISVEDFLPASLPLASWHISCFWRCISPRPFLNNMWHNYLNTIALCHVICINVSVTITLTSSTFCSFICFDNGGIKPHGMNLFLQVLQTYFLSLVQLLVYTVSHYFDHILL